MFMGPPLIPNKNKNYYVHENRSNHTKQSESVRVCTTNPREIQENIFYLHQFLTKIENWAWSTPQPALSSAPRGLK